MNRVSKHMLIGAAMLVVCAGVAMAQDAPPPRDGGDRRDGPGPGNFRLPPLAIMEAIDADKDGKLSAAEIKTAHESLRKLDKNTDGKLSADEIGWPPQFGGFGRGGGGRGGRGGPPGGRGGEQASRGLAERIMKRDSNADGKISKDELPRSMNRLFARADRNGDERIDETEAKQLTEELGLTAQPAPPAQPARP
jgi:hypothetical protein